MLKQPTSISSTYLKQRLERIGRVGDYLSTNVVPLLPKKDLNYFHLEVGSGHGHWLNSLALEHPDQVFIGIDLLSKRIRKSEKKKVSNRLANLFFLKADASEFLEAIPSELKVKNTFVMFPDPWPKKRHFKNRLIQHTFLQLLAIASTNDAKLYFRTDFTEYYHWTKDIISENPYWRITNTEWPHDSSSFFQNLFDTSYTCTAIRS